MNSLRRIFFMMGINICVAADVFLTFLVNKNIIAGHEDLFSNYVVTRYREDV